MPKLLPAPTLTHHWTVIRKDTWDKATRKVTYWCRCVCGSERSVRSDHLRTGKSQSCGCQWHNPVPGHPVTYRKPTGFGYGPRTAFSVADGLPPKRERKDKPTPKKPEPGYAAHFQMESRKVREKSKKGFQPTEGVLGASPATVKTIVDCRKAMERWADIAEITGLTIEHCKEIYARSQD